MTLRPLAIILALLPLASGFAADPKPVSFAAFASWLTDLDRLARTPPLAESALQASSADSPRSADGLLADFEGPGCLFAGLAAAKSLEGLGKLEIRVDAVDTPVYSATAAEFFQGVKPPFVPPLSSSKWPKLMVKLSGPIPFASRLRVSMPGAAGEKAALFYLFQYVHLPRTVAAQPFTALDAAAREKALAAPLALWRENLPQGVPPGKLQTKTATVRVKSGARVNLLKLDGSGIVRRLRLKPLSPPENWSRLLTLRLYFDEAQTPALSAHPAVRVPLGDFFCQGFGGPAEFDTIPLRWSKATGGEIRYPMPFAAGARVEVENATTTSLSIELEADVESMDVLPADYGRFHAAWRRYVPGKGGDAGLKLTDRGRYLGNTLAMTDPRLEPGPPRPEIFKLAANGGYPLLGLWDYSGVAEHRSDERKTASYRLLTADAIPFQRGFQATISTDTGLVAEATHFWYQAGVRLESEPYPPPVGRLAWRCQGFWSDKLIHADQLKIVAAEGKSAVRDSSRYPGLEWVSPRPLAFFPRAENAIFSLELPERALAPGRNEVWAAFAMGRRNGRVRLDLPGAALIDTFSPSLAPSGLLKLGELDATPGQRQIKLRVEGLNPAAADNIIEFDAVLVRPPQPQEPKP